MITQEDRERYQYHSESSILGIKLIRGLTDHVLQVVLDDFRHAKLWPTGIEFKSIQNLMNVTTNPNWIIARILDEAQDRRMLSNKEFDYLQEKVG